jgi:hypothetical protein
MRIWSIILAENEKSEQTYPIFCCRGFAEPALSKLAPPPPFAAPRRARPTAKLPGADDEGNEHCEASRREKAEDA